MARNRVLTAFLAGACSAGFAVAAAAQDGSPDAASVMRAVRAAKAAADAAEAAAAAARSAAPLAAAPPALLTAPPAPTPPPVLAFAAAPAPEADADILGSSEALPVASARLLAALTAEHPAPAAPEVPAAAPPTPPPAAPLAAPTLLASLGAAPVSLPSAAALEAAVAAQTTPILPPATVYAAAPMPAPASASYAPPRSRRLAAQTGNARFMRAVISRAVVSTAAVSIEMPDVGRQITPLGLLLGQLVTSQETPGSQYGLAEEMAMPTRPRLMAMPEVAVPQGFCSAQQRGAFVEGIYQPAMAIARHNSEAATAYVRKLRTLYDNYQLSGDTRAQEAIAAEAKDFARTANAASSIQDELTSQFEETITAPVNICGASQ